MGRMILFALDLLHKLKQTSKQFFYVVFIFLPLLLSLNLTNKLIFSNCSFSSKQIKD